jgi:hypothetical protein
MAPGKKCNGYPRENSSAEKYCHAVKRYEFS